MLILAFFISSLSIFEASTNILLPNRYQLLKPTSENIELVSENIQNTDALRLPGNENKLNRNRNVLTSQNTGSKRLSVVINK